MTCVAALARITRVHYVGPRGNVPRLMGWRCTNLSSQFESNTFRCSRGARAFRWETPGG